MNTPVTKRHPIIDLEAFERRLRQSSGNQTDDDPLAELARVISGQKEPVQRVAELQSQSSTEARQEATSLPEAQKTETEEPDALQSLDRVAAFALYHDRGGDHRRRYNRRRGECRL
jgi:hypothetical protein